MIYFSSIGFKPGSLENLFEQLRKHNISKVELTGDRKYNLESYSTIEGENNKIDIMLHNYCFNLKRDFLLNLAAPIENERKLILDHVEHLIKISSQLQNKFLGIHWGYTFESIYTPIGDNEQHKYNHVSFDQAYENFFDSLDKLIPIAKSNGIKLLVENNGFSFFNKQKQTNKVCLGTDQGDMLKLTSRYGQDEVGLLLDVAHAEVCKNTLGKVFTYAPQIARRIEWLHLSNCSPYEDDNLPFVWSQLFEQWYMPNISGCTIEVNEKHLINYPEQIAAAQKFLDHVTKKNQNVSKK